MRLAAELGVSPLVGQLLINRDISDAAHARTYLQPEFNKLHDPSELEDMPKVVDRIKQAKKLGEKICIYGDYDADGTTATALLLDMFGEIDVPVEYYIPNRFTEGYGLSKETVKRICETGAKLIITVDCGITSVKEVQLANDCGMDVIITDHHQPSPDGTPPAHALIAPKISESDYPYKDLAGVGLAFKLAQGLCDALEVSDHVKYLESLLDLVVIGTVVDLVPLTGENRALSRLGLVELNKYKEIREFKRKRVGIDQLCKVAGYGSKRLVGHSLSFVLGPRINAAGRMDTAHKVVKLLTTESKNVAEKIALELDNQNRERQKLEAAIRDEAEDIISRTIDDETKGIVVAGKNWGEKAQGVVGIVASRLVEKYHKPVFVIAINEDEATGSGRCIEGMNLVHSLHSCKELLIKYGGHAAAAGLTLKTKNILEFTKVFNEYASKELSDDDLKPKLKLDFETNLSVLTLETLQELERFEPFGRENNPPRFCTYRLKISGTPTLMGKEKQHLSMFVSDGVTKHRSIAWNARDVLVSLQGTKTSLDMAFSPEINEWQEMSSVQLMHRNWHIYSSEREGKHDIYPPSDHASVARVVDGRSENKKNYLLNLLDENESCIIYVQNSQMLELLLTRLLPDNASNIARYDDTMSGQETELLKKLEHGELKAIATNATFLNSEKLSFVKHFVFCHLTLCADEFFKRCKPAFTSEETSKIHLIYKVSDVTVMNNWIYQRYPEEVILKELYKNLRDLININDTQEIPENEVLNGTLGDPTTVEIGLTIFEELYFVERYEKAGERRIKLLPTKPRKLSCSGTYLKGEWIKQTCQYFSEFQLQQDIKKIWERVKDECGIPN